MILEELGEFADRLAPMQPIIGLDLGEKTIGVAASDGLLQAANALVTIKRKKFGVDAAQLLEIAQ
ncbi:MAG: Holliday junction resolvase RuvX, partial [Pseudomonadota bacterium]